MTNPNIYFFLSPIDQFSKDGLVPIQHKIGFGWAAFEKYKSLLTSILVFRTKRKLTSTTQLFSLSRFEVSIGSNGLWENGNIPESNHIIHHQNSSTTFHKDTNPSEYNWSDPNVAFPRKKWKPKICIEGMVFYHRE